MAGLLGLLDMGLSFDKECPACWADTGHFIVLVEVLCLLSLLSLLSTAKHLPASSGLHMRTLEDGSWFLV
jgi:hypothetical protein